MRWFVERATLHLQFHLHLHLNLHLHLYLHIHLCLHLHLRYPLTTVCTHLVDL